jgi:hypothetical protein
MKQTYQQQLDDQRTQQILGRNNRSDRMMDEWITLSMRLEPLIFDYISEERLDAACEALSTLGKIIQEDAKEKLAYDIQEAKNKKNKAGQI